MWLPYLTAPSCLYRARQDEKGNVFMATFLAKFFKIGLEERQERRSKWLQHRALLQEVGAQEGQVGYMEYRSYEYC